MPVELVGTNQNLGKIEDVYGKPNKMTFFDIFNHGSFFKKCNAFEHWTESKEGLSGDVAGIARTHFFSWPNSPPALQLVQALPRCSARPVLVVIRAGKNAQEIFIGKSLHRRFAHSPITVRLSDPEQGLLIRKLADRGSSDFSDGVRSSNLN